MRSGVTPGVSSSTSTTARRRDDRAPVGARVVIVSDVCLFRDLLAAALDVGDRLAVVGVAGGRAQVCDVLRDAVPDVVLLDVRMPDSEATIAAISESWPQAKIVALCVPRCTADVVRYARAGVAGYVFCDGELKSLVEAVRSAVREELSLPPRMTAELQHEVAALARVTGSGGADGYLTARELQVVELVTRGLGNKEIAGQLHLETATVKNHVHRILAKLHVRRRWQVTTALARGEAQPPAPLVR